MLLGGPAPPPVVATATGRGHALKVVTAAGSVLSRPSSAGRVSGLAKRAKDAADPGATMLLALGNNT